jgi:hypothetical protein
MEYEPFSDTHPAEEPFPDQSDRDAFEPAADDVERDDIEREYQFLVEWEVAEAS